jgi:hypothetical protein
MEPPFRGRSDGADIRGLIIKNENCDDWPSCADSMRQGRVIAQPQVIAEPQNKR